MPQLPSRRTNASTSKLPFLAPDECPVPAASFSAGRRMRGSISAKLAPLGHARIISRRRCAWSMNRGAIRDLLAGCDSITGAPAVSDAKSGALP